MAEQGRCGKLSASPCGGDLAWTGCYSGGYDLIVSEAYSHPAKMAPGLCFRIFEHLEELGLLRYGDVVCDPLAGTGMTGLVAAVKNYKSVLIELEEKFIGYIKANREALEGKLGHSIDMMVIQGDSRKLSELLTERGLIGVVSPPYQTGMGEPGTQPVYTRKGTTRGHGYQKDKEGYHETYGTSPGQIGAMPEGARVGITSPPYEESLNSTDMDFIRNRLTTGPAGSIKLRGKKGAASDGQVYGHTPNQIGNLRGGAGIFTNRVEPTIIDGRDILKEEIWANISCMSVPIVGVHLGVDAAVSVTLKAQIKLSILLSEIGKYLKKCEAESGLQGQMLGTGQVETIDGEVMVGGLSIMQLKNGTTGLAMYAGKRKTGMASWFTILSPGNKEGLLSYLILLPFAEAATIKPITWDIDIIWFSVKTAVKNTNQVVLALEPAPKNVEPSSIQPNITDGKQSAQPTYWSEITKVYAECLKVCDVLAIVTKNPTRHGKLHPLGRLTWECLEACGWVIVDYHQAILFTETEQGHMFEGKVKRVKGRMSFFKRLSYQKGSPVADHEDIIIAVNPMGRRWGVCGVSSPPFLKAQEGRGLVIGMKHKDGHSLAGSAYFKSEHGQTPGQIGNMPEGARIGIMSPPYSNMLTEQKPLSERDDILAEMLRTTRPRTYDKTGAGSAGHGYSADPANIGNLKE